MLEVLEARAVADPCPHWWYEALGGSLDLVSFLPALGVVGPDCLQPVRARNAAKGEGEGGGA